MFTVGILCVRQNPVQLGRAVDEGAEIHVDQSQVGSGVGFFAVCQVVGDGAPRLSHVEAASYCC